MYCCTNCCTRYVKMQCWRDVYVPLGKTYPGSFIKNINCNVRKVNINKPTFTCIPFTLPYVTCFKLTNVLSSCFVLSYLRFKCQPILKWMNDVLSGWVGFCPAPVCCCYYNNIYKLSQSSVYEVKVHVPYGWCVFCIIVG